MLLMLLCGVHQELTILLGDNINNFQNNLLDIHKGFVTTASSWGTTLEIVQHRDLVPRTLVLIPSDPLKEDEEGAGHLEILQEVHLFAQEAEEEGEEDTENCKHKSMSVNIGFCQTI